ncbi:DUF2218 domain-containing protein [Psychromarinibacter sp. C21-152]|uniref:DUF2218 domain-containing protein n=1 Tax=Psychromarinibacter sediminicola TaxID=3033385 RepID=A0AAE3NU05_9RHOB|nr:DUF2218 domain-containing protein [Psychromarinibacter sediminicola]MDF0602006.1 DUF2218 domain-containing protein [Psychromarinibacter sediminicola]
MNETLMDRGVFPTAKASRYLQQLCKHFAHKRDVTYDAQSGEVALPVGPARMQATESELVVEVQADDDESLARARTIIDSHLERFAFREEFKQMDWSGPVSL